MTLLQALVYFVREAAVGLLRSLRVSVLAVLTIAVTLFLSGALVLVSENLSRTVRAWRAEARFVVYLAPSADGAALAAVRDYLAQGRWTEQLDEISPAEARSRFERAFPSLADLVAERGAGALPRSFEARLRPGAAGQPGGFPEWVSGLRALPGVELVDADQDWIQQVETVLALVRALGIALTAILIGASVFTIASVVRLTSFLYRDEIAIMRLVGATEFYIRGPFYFEGILQGLFGGVLAAGALAGLHFVLRPRIASSLLAHAVAGSFLPPREIALLVAFGAVAGWVGAAVSLGRETLRSTAD